MAKFEILGKIFPKNFHILTNEKNGSQKPRNCFGKISQSKLTAVKRPYFRMAKNGKIRDF